MKTYYNLGTLYLIKKLYHKAVDILEQAIKLEPGNIKAYINLGDAYFAIGNYQRAKESYGFVLNIDPDNVIIRNKYNESAVSINNGKK